MTEVSSAAVTNLPQINVNGSVGIPLPKMNVCIFDSETNLERTYGEVGEICFSGPTLMKMYFHNPDETEKILRLHDDGKYWLHSGDIGYLTEDGLLYLKGRIKRVIVRHDGIKIAPYDIENIIDQIESVESSCVVGIDDIEHGRGSVPVVLVKDYENHVAYLDVGNSIDVRSLNLNIQDYYPAKEENEKYQIKSMSSYVRDQMATAVWHMMERHLEPIRRSNYGDIEKHFIDFYVTDAFQKLNWKPEQ